MSVRATWRAAVSAATFPVGMRPVKATLLSLPVGVDGALAAWRSELVEITGMPPRTVDRHLARAVDAGWLRHESIGGRGRQPRYVVTVPRE